MVWTNITSNYPTTMKFSRGWKACSRRRSFLVVSAISLFLLLSNVFLLFISFHSRYSGKNLRVFPVDLPQTGSGASQTSEFRVEDISNPIETLELWLSDHGTERGTFLQDAQNITKNMLSLPLWMQKYIVWHSQVRAQITKKNYKRYRFLVMRCRQADRSCGGLSDRLKPLPLLVQLAAASGRILLIHWQRPAPLEEFLQPTSLLDWRVPSWMQDILLHKPTRLYTKADILFRGLDRQKNTAFAANPLEKSSCLSSGFAANGFRRIPNI